MPVIYIDVLLILNAWVDFLLLAATARVRRIPLQRRRLLCGAVSGAVGSCILFLPPLPWWLGVLLRVAGTVALCRITFPFVGWRRFWGDLLVWTVISAAFAGLATALWHILSPQGFMVVNGVVYYDAPASLLIVFTALSYCVMCLYDRFTRRKIPLGGRYSLEISHRNVRIVCPCLYDTGCTLKEPFSGKPAALIDQSAARRLLPDGWQAGIDAVSHKMRLIPFKGVDGEGALPAFVPQTMAVTDEKGRRRDITGSYLAVGKVEGNGEFVALIGTDIGDLL